jgi:quaternary ammonium compound-resistance protein SugE
VVDLVVLALLAIGIGAVVWAADKRHDKYGALLPSGIAVVAALLTWIIAVSAGLSYQPGWTWVPWIASLVAAALVSVVASLTLGRGRAAYDTAHLTAILRR